MKLDIIVDTISCFAYNTTKCELPSKLFSENGIEVTLIEITLLFFYNRVMV
jgi:hypothetical protein